MSERASLEHLHPIWFVPVMGLSGLALAWWRAEALLGPWADAVAQVIAGLALLTLLAVAAASLWRMSRWPSAWQDDVQHPVRHVFVAAITVSLILIVTVLTRWWGPSPGLRLAWMLASLSQMGITLWVLSRWFRPGAHGTLLWPGVTPGLLIPVVGNVLAPLAGVSLGLSDWAAAQLGIGVVLWPLVLALLWVRIGVAGLWPERMRPSLFVLIAPPAVTGVSLLQLQGPLLVSQMLWGVALLFTALALMQLRACLAQPFGMPMWSLSFPLTALAALSLRLADPASLAGQVSGGLSLALATGVIAALGVATVRGLWRGQLLQAEPGPAPVSPRSV